MTTSRNCLILLLCTCAYANPQQIRDSLCSGRVTLAATAAEQTFTDGSGTAAPYTTSLRCEWLITAPAGAKVRLRFRRFNTDRYAKVWAYDGDSTGAVKLVDGHSGSAAPPPVVSSGASLLVRFTTSTVWVDQLRTGFEAVVSVPSCLAGTHSRTGYESCSGTACPLGQFGPVGSVGASAATCTPCNAGRYSGSAVGAGGCQACPRAPMMGGAAFVNGGSFSATHCTFSKNQVSWWYGGALSLDEGTIVCSSCTFDRNAAVNGDGGAVALQNSDYTSDNSATQQAYFWNTTFIGNTAGKRGAAIAVVSLVQGGEIDRTTFRGQLVVQDSVFRNNTAQGGGDAFYIETHPAQGEALFDNCRIDPGPSAAASATYAIAANSVVVLRGRDSGFDWTNKSWGQDKVTRLTDGDSTTTCGTLGPPALKRGSACPAYSTEQPLYDAGGRKEPQGMVCSTCAPPARHVPLIAGGPAAMFANPSDTSVLRFPALNWACECPAGYGFMKGADSSATIHRNLCSACEAGQHSRLNKTTHAACDPCEPGRYQDEVGQAACKPCAAGRYNPSDGGTSAGGDCQLCGAGKSSLAGALAEADCKSCAAGTFASDAGPGECRECTAGQYTSQLGQVECRVCGPGTRSTATNRSTSCTSCVAGRYQDQAAQSECKACAKGRYGKDASSTTACKSCVAGQYQAATGKPACDTCAAGKQGSGADQAAAAYCTDCDAGRHSASGATTCAACAGGQVQGAAGRASCVECSGADAYQDQAAQVSCKTCQPGSYRGSASSCIECPPGHTCDGSTKTKCAAGKYGDASKQTSCRPCVAGQYQAAEGKAACAACAAGKAGSGPNQAVASYCANCTAGRYSASGATTCAACGVGQAQSEAGGASCVACESGKYQSMLGQQTCSTCAQCPGGGQRDSCAGAFAGFCVPCAPGNFVNRSGVCVPCPAGTFSNKTQALACASCTTQTCEKEGGILTEGCGGSSAGVCIECYPGRFINRTTRRCQPCARDTYQDRAGQSQCKQCESGKRCDSEGLASGRTCQEGEACQVLSNVEWAAATQGMTNTQKAYVQAGRCPYGWHCPDGTIKGHNVRACEAGEIWDGSARCERCERSDQFAINNATRPWIAAAFGLSDRCVQCPKALNEEVECRNGELRFRNGFWHTGLEWQDAQVQAVAVHRTAGSFVNESITFFPCPCSDCCMADSTSGSVTCANGTAGALCAVCAADHFRRASGGECVPCEDVRLGSDMPWALCIVVTSFALLFAWSDARCEWKRLRFLQGHIQGCRRHLVGKSKIVLSFFQIILLSKAVYRVPFPSVFVAFIDRFAFLQFDMVSLSFSCETIVMGVQRSAHAQPAARSRWLHRDYAVDCDSEAHRVYEMWATAMIVLFAFGVPVLLGGLLYRHRRNLLRADAQYLAFLYNDYHANMWYWEVVECCRKLALTGVALFIGEQGSLVQVAVAMTLVVFYMVVLVTMRPYALPSDNALALLANMALFFTLVVALLLKIKTAFVATGRFGLGYSEESLGYLLVSVAVIVLVAWLWALVADVRRFNAEQSFRFAANGHLLTMPMLDGVVEEYHAFISHSQQDGGDQVANLKKELEKYISTINIFTDVAAGKQEKALAEKSQLYGAIERSEVFLVFLTRTFFTRKWCVKEFQEASARGKHIVLVLDTDQRHGGMAVDEFVEYATTQRERSLGDATSKASNLWNQAALDGDASCTALCQWVADHVAVPGGANGGDHLLIRAFKHEAGDGEVVAVPERSYPVIPWYRYAAEKKVALLLIAEAMLAAPAWGLPPKKRALRLPLPRERIARTERFHLCLSAFNHGSAVIRRKLEAFEPKLRLHVPARGEGFSPRALEQCDAILVLNNRAKVQHGKRRATTNNRVSDYELAGNECYQDDIRLAIDAGLRVILVHDCSIAFGVLQSLLWQQAGRTGAMSFTFKKNPLARHRSTRGAASGERRASSLPDVRQAAVQQGQQGSGTSAIGNPLHLPQSTLDILRDMRVGAGAGAAAKAPPHKRPDVIVAFKEIDVDMEHVDEF
eukprot:g1199.t1